MKNVKDKTVWSQGNEPQFTQPIARISSARPHRKVMGTSRERHEKSESSSLDIKEGPLVILLMGERIIV